MTSTPTRPTSAAPSVLTADAGRAIWLLLAAAFVAVLNETTMGVAIPHLIGDLHIDAVAAQWLTTAFMLTMAVVIPVTGFLLQRFTTRQVFVAAMSLFSLGTLMAFLSPGFTMLVIARVVQASGTAIMMPLLMTTLMTVVPPDSRGRMMGRVSIVMALAPAIGPTLSGAILDTAGWRWNFGIILPIALVALLVGARWIGNVGEARRAPIDVLSVILSAVGFGGVVYGLTLIGAAGTPTALLVGCLTVGAIGLLAFCLRQWRLQKVDDALLDLRVFRFRTFTLSIAQMGVLSFAFFGAITVLPLYLQAVHGLTALDSGLILLPGSLAMGLSGPLIGRVYDRYGTRVLLVPGAVLAAVMLWAYVFLDAHTPVWWIVIAQTVLALGLALSFTPLFTASLAALPRRFYSHGSAVVGTVQQVAGAAGIAAMIAVMSAVSRADGAVGDALTAGGSQAAFLIAAIVALPLVVGAFLIRKPADVIEDDTDDQDAGTGVSEDAAA